MCAKPWVEFPSTNNNFLISLSIYSVFTFLYFIIKNSFFYYCINIFTVCSNKNPNKSILHLVDVFITSLNRSYYSHSMNFAEYISVVFLYPHIPFIFLFLFFSHIPFKLLVRLKDLIRVWFDLLTRILQRRGKGTTFASAGTGGLR